ncbi:MAG TPA: SUMF1/EgtB/PvdO family nonheme iron enzyme [Leadbetterella sp.]|nr:SUMF1/EgtB/PvdO family nonheme iron enzyme [Leadbetterella sp.]
MKFLIYFLSLLLLTSSIADNQRSVVFKGGIFKTTDPETNRPKTVKIGRIEVDRYLVTVGEYQEFVNATGYKTQAEQYGNSIIFDSKTQKWELVEGANFRFPFGPNASPAILNHPVTQVSWYDAVAYANWKGKRLPTDAEWEYVAKSRGKSKEIYPWGSQDFVDGKYLVNSWQGAFPYYNSGADGFLTTSPVGFFGDDRSGLTDMGGNVWQWCQDAVQPTGCNAEDDLSVRRICRGGSFLCDKNVCHGYKIGNRTNSTPESGMVHIGFRCVKDIKI